MSLLSFFVVPEICFWYTWVYYWYFPIRLFFKIWEFSLPFNSAVLGSLLWDKSSVCYREDGFKNGSLIGFFVILEVPNGPLDVFLSSLILNGSIYWFILAVSCYLFYPLSCISLSDSRWLSLVISSSVFLFSGLVTVLAYLLLDNGGSSI